MLFYMPLCPSCSAKCTIRNKGKTTILQARIVHRAVVLAAALVVVPAAEVVAVERLRALLGQDGDFATLNAALCDGIQSGAIDPLDPAVLAHMKASIIDQVRIDQPQYSGLKTLTS